MRKAIVATLLLSVLAVAFAPAVHPRAGQKSADDEPIRLSAELIVVDAQVLSKKTGRVVGNLGRDDFTLYEDGVKQYVTHFSQDRLPLSIVLLLDVSGSVQPVINRVRDEGMTALGLLRPDDEVAVMAFGFWARVVQDFTKDRAAVISAIAGIEFMGPWIREKTYIYEAVYQAAAHLGKASNPDTRRCVIIITDNISNQPAGEAHPASAALEELLEAGAVMSALVVNDFNRLAAEFKRRGDTLIDSVSPFVEETGGLKMQVDKTEAGARLAELIERLRSRYSFGYNTTNSKQDGKFRNVKLKISPAVEKREGKIAIVARKGYYARAGSKKSP
jgi:VWFA-related protein